MAEQDFLGPRGQAETSLKIEDLRSNKTGKHSNKRLQSLDLKDSNYTCCMLYNAIMAFLVTM